METIKEEKKADLEQLLNSLIEKGWKPFGREPKKHWWIYCMKTDMFEFWIKFYVDDLDWIWEFVAFEMPIRSVVSIDSGLWQFCMANHLLKKYSDLWDDYEYVIWRWQNWMDWKTTDWEYIDENYDSDIYHQDESYQYRLIESALKDESELEKFLLSNINVEWEV